MSRKTKTTATKEAGKPALVPKLRFTEFRKAEGWKETLLQKIARPVSDRAVTGDGDNVLSLSGEHGVVFRATISARRSREIARNDTSSFFATTLFTTTGPQRHRPSEPSNGYDADHWSGSHWTQNRELRKMLAALGYRLGRKVDCENWTKVPPGSLTATQWNPKKETWHWVVYDEDDEGGFVLDPNPAVKRDKRRDFEKMKVAFYHRVNGVRALRAT